MTQLPQCSNRTHLKKNLILKNNMIYVSLQRIVTPIFVLPAVSVWIGPARWQTSWGTWTFALSGVELWHLSQITASNSYHGNSKEPISSRCWCSWASLRYEDVTHTWKSYNQEECVELLLPILRFFYPLCCSNFLYCLPHLLVALDKWLLND